MRKLYNHIQILDEAFDRPYPFRKQELYKGFIVYRFITDDKSEVDVLFQEHELSDEESVWSTSFERGGRQDMTGEGDSMRIFSTVISIVKDFVKKYKPQELGFSAEKPAWRMTLPYGHPQRSPEMGSREKLYKRLIQRYAGKMGYTYKARTSLSATDFNLVRK